MVAQSMHCVVRRDPHNLLCGHGADVDRFCAFLVARECMRRNRLQGQPALDGVDPRFTDLFEKRICVANAAQIALMALITSAQPLSILVRATIYDVYTFYAIYIVYRLKRYIRRPQPAEAVH